MRSGGIGLNLASLALTVNSFSPDQARSLRALSAGYHLKSPSLSGRGRKVNRLHDADGQVGLRGFRLRCGALEALGLHRRQHEVPRRRLPVDGVRRPRGRGTREAVGISTCDCLPVTVGGRLLPVRRHSHPPTIDGWRPPPPLPCFAQVERTQPMSRRADRRHNLRYMGYEYDATLIQPGGENMLDRKGIISFLAHHVHHHLSDRRRADCLRVCRWKACRRCTGSS